MTTSRIDCLSSKSSFDGHDFIFFLETGEQSRTNNNNNNKPTFVLGLCQRIQSPEEQQKHEKTSKIYIKTNH